MFLPGMFGTTMAMRPGNSESSITTRLSKRPALLAARSTALLRSSVVYLASKPGGGGTGSPRYSWSARLAPDELLEHDESGVGQAKITSFLRRTHWRCPK